MRTIEYYQQLLLDPEQSGLLPGFQSKLRWALDCIRKGQRRYFRTSERCEVPWVLIGALHHMEGSSDFQRSLGDGSLLPEGVSWDDDAAYALLQHSSDGDILDNIPACLQFAERWNGWGYAKRNLNSPYIWSGTKAGIGVGKFVSDGTYCNTAFSAQIGVAPILKLAFEAAGILPIPAGVSSEQIRSLQGLLNDIWQDHGMSIVKLRTDGYWGPKTSAAISMTFMSWEQPDEECEG